MIESAFSAQLEMPWKCQIFRDSYFSALLDAPKFMKHFWYLVLHSPTQIGYHEIASHPIPWSLSKHSLQSMECSWSKTSLTTLSGETVSQGSVLKKIAQLPSSQNISCFIKHGGFSINDRWWNSHALRQSYKFMSPSDAIIWKNLIK